MPKIFIIAGEASGDLHGANLVKALLNEDESSQIKAYGGTKMSAAGAEIVRNYEKHAYMGFYEVVIHLRSILQNLKTTCQLIEEFRPDHLIFIDFPGFNIRIAKKLKAKLPQTQFHYYISPKVWAWKSNRVHILDQLMDKIYVIFPFEVDFYAQYGYEVTYVGNPLMDEISNQSIIQKNPNLVAILPGSRKQEIEKMLPIFSSLASRFSHLTFEISTMDQFSKEFYEGLIATSAPNLKLSSRSTYNLLAEATAAIVTSGTATLETALFDTPQIVAYKTSRLSYEIGKRVVKTIYISLVNLILDKEAVRELIQSDLNIDNLVFHLEKLIENPSAILEDYKKLRKLLGKEGASQRVAKLILNSR